MAMVYLICVVLLLTAMAISLYRVGVGPSWYDRILAANTFTTKTILLISVYFFASGYPEYLDIALLYALINYVGTLAYVNHFNNIRRRRAAAGAKS